MSTKKQSRSQKAATDQKKAQGAERSSYFTPSGIREFIREVGNEFKKVVWPERKVTVGLTAFVLILVVVISLYLGSVDFLLGKVVSVVLKR